ncbi:MAG: DUF2058 family protein [Rudaea sp.]|nr:DUF2058 family protein [Rudaea sp.]
MADSLRDQLLKSGLVQKFKSETRPERPSRQPQPVRAPKPPRVSAPRAPANSDVDLARAYALRARQEKDERERIQREAESAAREKKERKQKLAAVLDGKALNSAEADVPRHFPHGNKIRRVYCTPDQLSRLNRGELAVVQLAGRYLLVHREIANQAHEIQAESLVLLCDPDAPGEDDVPADLVW